VRKICPNELIPPPRAPFDELFSYFVLSDYFAISQKKSIKPGRIFLIGGKIDLRGCILVRFFKLFPTH